MGDSPNERRGRDRDRNRREKNTSLDNSRDRSNDRGGGAREPRSMRPSQNRVYVSNIPYEYRWQDIKDLFRSRVGDVTFVELFLDDNEKMKGSGIVEFSDSDLVRKCLEVMQRFEVKDGRKLVVKDDAGVTRDKHGAITGRGGGGGARNRNLNNDRFRDNKNDMGGMAGMGGITLRGDDSKWGNTYGLSAQFLESLKIDPPLNNKVFVANLDYNIDEKKLKEVFRLAGRIINVDLPLNKDGKVRGFAVIEYDHPVEAVQAISMFQGQTLNDRTMAVRMDRANDGMKLPDGLRSIGMGLGPNGEPLKNVAHNLPSLSNNSSLNSGVVGSGILGAVPNNSLSLASALSGLSGVGNLGNLNSQVLQQSNLANLSSLLGNGLGATDLSSLVQNPLAAQNSATQQLAALTGQGSNNNLGSFSRNSNDNSYGDMQSQNTQNSFSANLGSGRNYSSGGGGGTGNFTSAFSNNNGSRFSQAETVGGGKSFSKKVLVTNLPPTASYKLLNEKFSEFGDVHAFEEKGHGSVLVTYGSDWQAERAIKNLDKARVDGRMIDARLYF